MLRFSITDTGISVHKDSCFAVLVLYKYEPDAMT